MAHFAEIQNNIVTRVLVVNNEDIDGGTFPASEPLGQAFLAACGITGDFLQCSYSGSFRGAYPGPGWTWTPKARTKESGIFEPPPVVAP
jgi:hypothetical protein